MIITIRPATAADAALLRALLLALARHEGDSDVASEAALLSAGFGPQPLFRALIAEGPGQPLGLVIFYPDFSTHRGEPGLYVQDLYVAPEARGRGLGRRLLGAALAAQDWGARYLTLGVDPGNDLATSFYAGLGFRKRRYDYLILDGEGLAALPSP